MHAPKTKKLKIATKALRIKIRVDRKQQQTFRSWFGVSRKYYNTAIGIMNDKEHKAYGLADVAAKVDEVIVKEDYIDATPFSMRRESVGDACKAVKNAISKYKETGRVQKCGFRTKRDTSQSMAFDNRDIRRVQGKTFMLYGQKIALKERVPEIIGYSRIVMVHRRYFYLAATVALESRALPGTDRAVALDPGVCTFQTFYSEDLCGKIGSDASNIIYKRCIRVDALESKIAKAKQQYDSAKGLLRKQLRRIINFLRRNRSGAIEKVKHLRDELHWKTCGYLVRRFDLIFLPEFKSSEMVSTLHSKTARAMLTLSHYTFRERLKYKGAQCGVRVVICSEEYTTQTCGSCGLLSKPKNRTYECKHCPSVLDRDINGARNILLKGVVASGW
jgi:putative transposase